MLQKINKTVWLYDFYCELLTAKQQDIFKLYYFQDFSLAEIAENQGISRQAVYDLVKRTEELLSEYESKLKLYKKYLLQKQKIEELNKVLLDLDKKYDKEILQNAIKGLEELEKLTRD